MCTMNHNQFLYTDHSSEKRRGLCSSKEDVLSVHQKGLNTPKGDWFMVRLLSEAFQLENRPNFLFLFHCFLKVQLKRNLWKATGFCSFVGGIWPLKCISQGVNTGQ